MADLDKRRDVWDTKLSSDSEFRFRVSVRRNQLLGRWVAEQLGLEGEAARQLIVRIIKSDFEEVGDEDVIRAMIRKLKAGGIEVDEAVIRKRFATAQGEAIRQLAEGD